MVPNPETDNRAAIELADMIRSKDPNKYIRFPVYINEPMNGAELELLELSVRANNCLRRMGYRTIGQLVDSIDGMQDLLKGRNLGKKTAQEIMFKIYLYQYSVLKPERKKEFLKQVMRLNQVD